MYFLTIFFLLLKTTIDKNHTNYIYYATTILSSELGVPVSVACSRIEKAGTRNKTGGNWGEEGHHRPLFPGHALIFSRAFRLRVFLLSESLEHATVSGLLISFQHSRKRNLLPFFRNSDRPRERENRSQIKEGTEEREREKGYNIRQNLTASVYNRLVR